MLKRILHLILAGLVLSVYPLSGGAEDEAPRASAKSFAESGVQSPNPMIISAPTMPFVPPILPSFYNDPQFAEREYGGRSLSYVFAVCGDGVYDPGEQCDDGNREGEDGCSDLCQLEDLMSCGDGKRGPGETCDDGNVMDGDGCSATCQSEGVCGDGSQDPGEQCDDGNSSSGDGCSNKCLSESIREEDVRNSDTLNEDTETRDRINEDVEIKTNVKDTKNLLYEEDLAEEEVEILSDTRVVRYVQGRGIASPPECSATCTMARVYLNNVLEQEYEVVSERKITGGNYSTAFGEVSCATGQVISLSENALTAAAEVRASGSAAQVTGCSA